MTLREYLKQMQRTLEVKLAKSTLWEYNEGVNVFCEWLGSEIALTDVSPAIIERFREVNHKYAGKVRAIMATHDPVKFRIRNPKLGAWKRADRSRIPSAASVYLINVYEQRYEPLALRSWTFNCKRLYRTTLRIFDRFLERAATLDDLNDETVSRFAAWRLGKGLSKSSVNSDLFGILALWRWCHRKGIVDRWPDVQLEKPPRRVPVAWLEAEIRKLVATTATLEGKIGRLPACDFWTALVMVCFWTGERISAVIALDWSNVDLKGGWVRFPAEDRKGRCEDSSAKLPDEAIAALRKIDAAEGPVFPWPYSFSYIWRRYGAILKLAGLPNDRLHKFHCIRKTVGSYVEAAGGNATATLRHSNRKVTQAYLDPRIVKQQQPADVLFLLNGAGGAEGGGV